MKRTLAILSLLAVPLFSGCAAGTALGIKKEDFRNRLTMTVACDEVRTDSQWFGLFGVSATIDAADAKPVLDARCGRGPAAATPAAPTSAASAAK